VHPAKSKIRSLFLALYPLPPIPHRFKSILMKHLFALLLLAFAGQITFAQAPVREATNVHQDPVLGPKKFELERFSTQVSRLRNACTAHDANETAVYESAVMTAMRQAVEERTTKPLALPSAARDLEKMQEIFTAFTVYTSFDAATPTVVMAKFALLDEFQGVLQHQYDALK